jgi:8-oxo-dGTP diphosphatase
VTGEARQQQVRNGAAPTIRTANKALIVDGDQVLVTVNQEAGVEFYLLPGGGQEWGEDRVAGLRRECREEIGCDVVVHDLAFLRSYIGANHRWADVNGWFHQEEAYWWCSLAEGAVPAVGAVADVWQTGVAWKTVSELRESGEFSPWGALDWLELAADRRPLYLGDCP